MDASVETARPQDEPRAILDLAIAPDDRDGGRAEQNPRAEEGGDGAADVGDVVDVAGGDAVTNSTARSGSVPSRSSTSPITSPVACRMSGCWDRAAAYIVNRRAGPGG
jgi:hypothetical protein